MKYEIIILVLGGMLSLIYLTKIRNTVNTFIVAIQVLSIGLTLTINPTFGYSVFGIAILISLLYPIIKKERSLLNISVVWLFLIPLLIVFVLRVLNLPGFNYARLAMLIPFIVFAYAVVNKKEFKYEISFMILFVADALIRFIDFFN